MSNPQAEVNCIVRVVGRILFSRAILTNVVLFALRSCQAYVSVECEGVKHERLPRHALLAGQTQFSASIVEGVHA